MLESASIPLSLHYNTGSNALWHANREGRGMLISERDLRDEQALDIAQKMLVAARTAPKGKGIDIIECAVITDEHVEELACEMEAYAEEKGHMFFIRDADNIRVAQAVVLIGTRPQLMGLDCGHCGYPTCGEKPREVPCAINCTDVGIAIGSACATAADMRVDSRVMFSAGLAAERLGLLGEGVGQVYAIPLSIGSKSPFFDRKSTRPAGE